MHSPVGGARKEVTQMHLSDEEQRQLTELERALALDDPRFVERFARARLSIWERLRRRAYRPRRRA
jgi:hypothetical protein